VQLVNAPVVHKSTFCIDRLPAICHVDFSLAFVRILKPFHDTVIVLLYILNVDGFERQTATLLVCFPDLSGKFSALFEQRAKQRGTLPNRTTSAQNEENCCAYWHSAGTGAQRQGTLPSEIERVIRSNSDKLAEKESRLMESVRMWDQLRFQRLFEARKAASCDVLEPSTD